MANGEYPSVGIRDKSVNTSYPHVVQQTNNTCILHELYIEI